MVGLIIFGLAVVCIFIFIFIFIAYSWFKAYFRKALELGIKELKIVFFFIAIVFCALLYSFIAGILLIAGFVLNSICHGFYFSTKGDLAVFTVWLSSLVLLIICCCLNSSRKKAERQNAEMEMNR